MTSVSTNFPEKATKKRPKITRSRLEVSSKVVAFQQIISLTQNKISERQAAKLLEVPFSTMRSWGKQKKPDKIDSDLAAYISTISGEKFLDRLVMSAFMAIRFGHGGIRGLQEFLQLSGLDKFVASSEGALHAFVVRCEEHMIAFGANQEMQLAARLKQRKVTAGLDEMFRGRHPCLVAIEVISGYILLEQFTEDRTAATWSEKLNPRLQKLNLKLEQIVSDLCGGIRACAKEMGAVHIPDLFHAQQEITKATSAPLASQEAAFKANLAEAEEKLQKALKKHGQGSQQFKKAQGIRNLRGLGYENRKERRNKVREAKKELGRVNHPINLETGKLQTAENVEDRFNDQLTAIEKCVLEADLSSSCIKRLAKARRAFDAIKIYMTSFFIFYQAYVNSLEFSLCQKSFFNDVVFPLSYLLTIWRRLPKKEREKLQHVKDRLEKEFAEASYSDEEKVKLKTKGRECAERFQRSTSCVEGRNGVLSLYHHRFCRLNERSCQALTVVHNFHLKQSDGTTAAKRFFACEHASLFESLVANVRIPGKPSLQHHDLERRQAGWEKRRSA